MFKQETPNKHLNIKQTNAGLSRVFWTSVGSTEVKVKLNWNLVLKVDQVNLKISQ